MSGITASKRRLGLFAIVATSLATGFGEAGLFYLIVQSATAASANNPAIQVHFGPADLGRVDIGAALTVAMLLLAMLLLLGVLSGFITARLSAANLTALRRQTFGAFSRARWIVQSAEPEGRLQELLSGHVSQVSIGILSVVTAVAAIVSFTTFLASAIVINPLAAVIIIGGAGFLSIALRPLNIRARRASAKNRVASADYASMVAEAARVSREVRTFGVASAYERRLRDQARLAGRTHRSVRFFGRINPMLYQYAALLLVVCGLAAVVHNRSADAANLGTIVLLLIRALSYSQQFAAAVQSVNESVPYVEELHRVIDCYEAAAEQTGERQIDDCETLQFRDVHFSYDDRTEAIRGVSFGVSQGEFIGVVGPSGGGKSTLVKLLLRLLEPSAGTIEVNGIDLPEIAETNWRRVIAFVPQDHHLIYGTVAENIDFCRGLALSELVAAAKAAHLHDDITRLPDGYNTVVGGGRGDLSGGQRQRLSIARALAGRPRVLVLDEPTAALDLRSEKLVQETLVSLRGDLTLFVIAHRVSTMTVCDRIMVLEDGKVHSFGPHAQVVKENAFYRQAVGLAARSAGDGPFVLDRGA